MVSNYRSNWKRKKLPAIISKKKKNIVEKQQITDIKSIAENFNKYFTEIGPTLEEKVESSTTFYKYLEAYNNT